ncbi:phosphoketolase family protein [Acidithiobacillus caldus]|nr:hypothetical protein [Acidithiobacillus caldus]
MTSSSTGTLPLRDLSPYGLAKATIEGREFEALFTSTKTVVFNFHSYPWLIHKLTYRRPGQHNIHVRGYKEKGNINQAYRSRC